MGKLIEQINNIVYIFLCFLYRLIMFSAEGNFTALPGENESSTDYIEITQDYTMTMQRIIN